jgi:hypothetical protein
VPLTQGVIGQDYFRQYERLIVAILEQLGNLGDAVAGIAVLISIIFLAKEVRAGQN